MNQKNSRSQDIFANAANPAMSHAELGDEYIRLGRQLREENSGAFVDTMCLIIRHDGSRPRSERAFQKVVDALLTKPDERTRFYLESFELFVLPKTELKRIRRKALAKLPPAPAAEPQEP